MLTILAALRLLTVLTSTALQPALKPLQPGGVPLQPAEGSRTISIPGRVVSAAGPVAGARIEVWTAGPREGPAYLCPSCYRDCGKSATTDTAGRFILPELDAALIFRLLVIREGFTPQFVGGVDPAKLTKAGLEITLEPRPAADMRDDRVVRGVVLSPAGDPVEGAIVAPEMVWWNGWSEGRGGAVPGLDPLAVTNAKGEFAVAYSGPCDGMDLTVNARGFAQACLERLPVAAVKPSHTITLSEGAAVSGRVVLDGKPVPGATVCLLVQEPGALMCHERRELATDVNGRFTFVNVQTLGKYSLSINQAPDWAQAKGLTRALPRTVDVREAGKTATAADLELIAGCTVKGRLVTSDGGRLPPSTIIVLGTDGCWETARAPIAEDGSFDVRGVIPGKVRLELNPGGAGLKHEFSQRNASAQDWAADCLIGTVDKDIPDLLLYMEPAGTFKKPSRPVQDWERPLRGLPGWDGPDTGVSREPPTSPGVVEGAVRGPDGPVANAVVLLGEAWLPEGIHYSFLRPGFGTLVRTGPDGRFNAQGVDPRFAYAVTAAAPGGRGARAQVMIKDNRTVVSTDIDLPGPVADQGTRWVEGVVVGTDGRPLEGAMVQVRSTKARSTPVQDRASAPREGPTVDAAAATGPDGRFRLAGRGSFDALELAVHAPGLPTVVVPSASDREPSRIVLGPGSRIRGRVLNPDGKPAPAARVRAVDAREYASLQALPWAAEADADDAGAFELPGIPAGGRILVVVEGGDLAGALTTPVRDDATTVEVGDLRLAPAVRLAGRVEVDATPSAGSIVAILMMDSGDLRLAKTDPQGRFAVDRIRPGAPCAILAAVPQGARLDPATPSAGWTGFPGLMGAATEVHDLALNFAKVAPGTPATPERHVGPLRGVSPHRR